MPYILLKTELSFVGPKRNLLMYVSKWNYYNNFFFFLNPTRIIQHKLKDTPRYNDTSPYFWLPRGLRDRKHFPPIARSRDALCAPQLVQPLGPTRHKSNRRANTKFLKICIFFNVIFYFVPVWRNTFSSWECAVWVGKHWKVISTIPGESA